MIETWLVIPGTTHEVSNLGRARNKKGKLLKPQISTAGYYHVGFQGKTIQLHVVICSLFVGPKPASNYLVRHKDDNKLHNVYTNLIWGTHQDNADDAIKNGRITHGETHPSSVLTQMQVNYIREELAKGVWGTASRLSREFGVSRAAISLIKIGKNWTCDESI